MIVAPQPGQPGKDVFGAPIPPERSEGSQIVAQKGVDVDKDGIVTATTGGRLVYVAQRVSVRPFDRLDRDIVVGAELETPGRDLIVEGIVGSGVNLSSEHSVVVVGSVESARIACGVDLIIKGGAVGAGDAALTAKRDVVFKFAEESRIEAGHHVIADASLVRAEIVAGACVIAPRAVLVGGYVRARCGIIAGTVGNDVMTPTRLSVGAEIDVARRAIELEELLKNKRAELERIQRSLAPLEVNRRRLSPVQKEELTELTFDASTVADSIQKIKDERQARLRALNDGAFIHVMDSVFEGVELVIADRCCRIKRKIVGPVRFEKKRTHGATEMVATFQNAGRVLTLNSRAMI